MTMLKKLSAASLMALVFASPTMANNKVLYCVVEHTVGLAEVDGVWKPAYAGASAEKRYTIYFSDGYTNVTGIEGTDTQYACNAPFPTKAPDIINCTNSKVATMVFSYSIENGRFVLSLLSPAGWLGVDTERQQNATSLSDHLVLGKCQNF